MGFNNGYESGFSDCERENRKKWEEAAVAKYIAEHGSGGGAAPSRKFLVSCTETIQYDGADRTVTFGEDLFPGLTDTDSMETLPATLLLTEEASTLQITAPSGGWLPGDRLVMSIHYYDQDFVYGGLGLGMVYEVDGTRVASQAVDHDNMLIILAYDGEGWTKAPDSFRYYTIED